MCCTSTDEFELSREKVTTELTRAHNRTQRILGAVPATAITTLETSAPDKSGSRERRPRAVAARAEERLADRGPYITSKRPELSLLRAIRRAFVSIRRVVEVRLDRRGRATKPVRDLGDGQTLGLTEVAGQRDGAATLDHAVIRRRASAGDHASAYWLHRRNSRCWRCSETRRAEWALANTHDGQARPKGGPRPSRAPLLDLAFLHSPGEGSVRRHPAAAHAARRG